LICQWSSLNSIVMMIPKPKEVRPIGKYEIHVSYTDGVAGAVDLSYLAAQDVFQPWTIGDFFFNVHLDPESKAIAWNEHIELCTNSIYLKILGLTFEEWKEKNEFAHAVD